jgi:Flp pilus assembly protein TadB
VTAVAVLVVLWLAVLVPQAVKNHNERRQEFLDSFERGLGALSAATPRRAAKMAAEPAVKRPVRRRPSAAKRRRTILGLLLASIAFSVVPALVVGGKTALVVHLAVDNIFLAYVGLLVRWRDSRTPRPAVPVSPLSPWDEDDDALVVAAPRVRAAFPLG